MQVVINLSVKLNQLEEFVKRSEIHNQYVKAERFYQDVQIVATAKKGNSMKIPRSFQNVLQIEALQFRLRSKFIQDRNQRFSFFRC